MKKKKHNKWKTGTICFGIALIIVIMLSFVNVSNEEEKERERICDIISGTPAWIDSDGRVMGYGLIQSDYKDNQTKVNDTILVDALIENRVTFVYKENCGYCTLQKKIFGKENFERLKLNGLALECDGE